MGIMLTAFATLSAILQPMSRSLTTSVIDPSVSTIKELRDDDKPETVQHRLGVYHAQTQPLIDYYGTAGVLKTVDGTKDMDQVFEDIMAVL